MTLTIQRSSPFGNAQGKLRCAPQDDVALRRQSIDCPVEADIMSILTYSSGETEAKK